MSSFEACTDDCMFMLIVTEKTSVSGYFQFFIADILKNFKRDNFYHIVSEILSL